MSGERKMAHVVDVSAHIFPRTGPRIRLPHDLGGILPAWARGGQALTAEPTPQGTGPRAGPDETLDKHGTGS